ncbi:MAG TPA: SDR family NAD(P)-dependent oxidoreductase [Thermoanaerobaculia bacterium]|nr:SDR family NAD(P)-dependent oxidoreductase [Thermoanaerobaculia bacterium]
MKRDYIVRHAIENDLERLVELEDLCWQHTRTSARQIRSRLETYPQGQFVLEREGKVLGVIYSQRIATADALATRTAADVHELHDPSGSTVQLLAVNIDPQVQNVSYGDQLLEFMLQRCGLMTGVTQVVGVTLCKNYRAGGAQSLDEYILQQGSDQDPVLAFHQDHGAEVVKVIAGYRPEDQQNGLNGVLVAYDILNRTPRERTRVEERVTSSSITPREIELGVDAMIKTLLGPGKVEAFARSSPLMEMGLDSADLMSLGKRIGTEFLTDVKTAVFFQHNTAEKIVFYLTAHLSGNVARANPADVAPEIVPASPVRSGDVAIVGIGCRLPGGIRGPEQLWEFLMNGGDAIGAMPPERWDWPEGIDPAGRHAGIDRGGFLEDIASFDARFFRITPREAELVDPQQRILLELAWETLEDAGYPASKLAGGNTGVFVGASGSDYNVLLQRHGNVDAHMGTSTAASVLPNRISYFYDFHGPSLLIDTACSSSLVALHQAVRSLRAGECDHALVAGVNVMCTPATTMAYYKAGMIAQDGRCKTFDRDANGYGRSEGAVMVLLKPLVRAIADDDFIYAVIKGSAVNHGGQASGLTVPNPQEQTALLLNAYRDADVPLQSIGYIEAHGTGTPLGDPIEIAAIQEAFHTASRDSDPAVTPCGIGSIKTNLGHLEAAAGLAGLVKVALSLNRAAVPKHINFASLNPAIDLSHSPLFVTTEAMTWTPDRVRRAGVSSFGSGGANAHAVLEAYPQDRKRSSVHGNGPWLFVLSAKNEERLRAHADQLSSHLSANDGNASNAALSSLALTLQSGREVMAARLAIIASSAAELTATLARFQAREAGIEALCYHEDAEGVPATEHDPAVVREAVEQSDLHKIAALWTTGAVVPWERLPGRDRVTRSSAPTYPFARTQYWIEPSVESAAPKNVAAPSTLHPLLDSNASTMDEQKFAKRLRREEEFLKHHVVLGTTILPGVAHLEMARAAAELSLQRPVRVLKNIIWGRPLILDEESKDVVVALRPEGKVVGFEIRSQDDASAVFSRGRIETDAATNEVRRPTSHDLNAIRARCPIRKNQAGIFEHLESLGFAYGPPFQRTDELFSGETEALVRFTPPVAAGMERMECQLSPTLMDSAIRTSFLIGLEQNSYNDRLRVPFSLGKLEILAALDTARYAYARLVQKSSNGDFVSDITILDENGLELLLFENFLAKPFRQARPAAESLLYFTPSWQEAAAGDVREDLTRACFILCGPEEITAQVAAGLIERHHVAEQQIISVRAGDAFEWSAVNRYSLDLADPQQVYALLNSCRSDGYSATHIVDLAPLSHDTTAGAASILENLQQVLDRGLLSVAALATELARTRPRDKVDILFCYPAGNDVASAANDSVAGLAKALTSVHFGIGIRCLQIGGSGADAAQCVLDELGVKTRPELEIRYESGQRLIRRLKASTPPSGSSTLLRERGTYLITGGLGGLGFLFAQHLANTCHANLVLVGRSSVTPDKEARLEKLKTQATSVHYVAADVSDYEQLSLELAPIRKIVGPIHGVFHAAGVAGQQSFVDATRESFHADIAAKVHGTVALDLLTSDDPLDCFVLFSSLSSYLGDFGRGSYAASNRFLDSFAVARNALCDQSSRAGRTVSINWPFWRDGGFGAAFFRDEAGEKLYYDYSGLRAITDEEGIAAFERAWELGVPEVVIAAGDAGKIAHVLPVGTIVSAPPRAATVQGTGDASQLERVIGYLKQKIATVIKAPASSLASQEPLGSYGIDSLIIMELNRALEVDFESLPGTLFFEFGTVHDLAGYFIKNHALRLEAILGPAEPSTGVQVAVAEVTERRPEMTRFRESGSEPPTRGVRDRTLDIAIIGMSGRYPQARNLERFWENLKLGVDAIEEIPAARWDYREFYSPDEKKPGSTNSKWGGFVEDMDRFDASFFNISPREAHYMDPQQRLFLEVAWETCEDAGYSWERARNLEQLPRENQVGVFVGLMYDDYHFFEKKISTSYWNSFVANRVSHFFNFRGPSMTIDTACSSSLTTVYMACESLRNEHCYAAIAGGTNLSIHPRKYARLSQLNMLSSDGKCKSFGKGGNGYVPGEGVGAVLLKRVEDAVRDGDHIYAVIKGGALNHGGKTNGFTVPNPNAHAALIGAAIDNSGISPRTISYLEAHGTGTELGDPIEISGLTNTFRKHTADRQFCAIGSVKSNIGHLEGAAGIAALTKVVLQLQHKQLVPSLNAAETNPLIDFRNSPFALQQELAEWKKPAVTVPDGLHEYPRRAGISSFGAGGANAHLIVEEYESAGGENDVRHSGPVLIPLSAKTEDRLEASVLKLLAFCRRGEHLNLRDVAYTLQTGRQAMEWRAAFVARDVADLSAKLESFSSGADAAGCYRDRAKRGNEIVTVFGSDDDLKEAVARWIAKQKLDKLAELWTKGLEVDWMMMYGDRPPRRTPLPTYPFAGERYWVQDEIDAVDVVVPIANPTGRLLHPLVHENTSNFAEQKFLTTFRVEDPWVSTRGNLGERSVSEAVYLEMARAAGVLASGEEVAEIRDFQTENAAIFVAGTSELTILLAAEGDAAQFEIRGGESLLLASGTLMLGSDAGPSVPPLSVKAAQSGDREASAVFECGETSALSWHPVAVTTAWETAVALLSRGTETAFQFAPRRIRSVRLHGEPAQNGFVLVRVAPGKAVGELTVDIDLAAGDGRVFLSMRGVEFVVAHVQRKISLDDRLVAAPVRTAKPAGISLAAPSAVTAASPSVRKPAITLSIGEVAVAPSVRVADGIFSIAATNIPELLHALRRVQSEASVKVLMLSGIERCFTRDGREDYNDAVEQKLYQALVSFPYPVIAVLQAGAVGAAFLAAALCDFMVCSEDAQYGYADADRGFHPTTPEAVLLSARFGAVHAEDLLYRSTVVTGEQLRAKGWTCPILPGPQVEAYAQQLASSLAAKSQDALRLLKQHLTRDLGNLVDELTHVEPAAPTTEEHAEVLVVTGARELVARLADGMHSYSAIVMIGDEAEIADDDVLELQRAVAGSEFAIVAALSGNARGNAWLIAQFCDGAVYSKTGVYSTGNDAVTPVAAALFAHRLGTDAATEILLTGADYSGRDLQQRVGALIAVEQDQVLPAAMNMAKGLARLPRATLAAWRKHAATALRQGIRSVALTETTESTSVTSGPIALQSRVVSATAHPDGIVVIEMADRDAKNMFSVALVEGVAEAFAHIEQTPGYKVVILTGYDSYFASGGTKESLLAIQEGSARFTDFNIYQLALDCRLPVIAAMQGHGIGAGWSLGMFADVVLLSEESRYVSPYMDYGFTPGAGATFILAEKIGQDLARESLMTAQPSSGRELKERGLALRVMPRTEVPVAAMAMAKEIARSSRAVLIDLKQRLTAHLQPKLEETYRLELDMHEQTFVGRSDTLTHIQNKFHQEVVESEPAIIEPPVRLSASRSGDADALRAVSAVLKTLLVNELQVRESDVEEHVQFVDLGLDSISGVTWVRKINEKYQTSIEATKVYSYPTLAQLSRYVKNEAEQHGTLAAVATPVPSSVIPVAVAASLPVAMKIAARPAADRRPTWRTRAETDAGANPSSPGRPEPIAVIGMAGQFPQADNVDEFWQNIAQGRNCITQVPSARWDVNAYYQPGEPAAGKSSSQWAGALEHYDRFDPLFFNISPTEAESIDPQQRLFLQACWNSIENAGYDARALSGSKCGVFVGCTNGDYHQSSREHQLSAQGFTGSAMSILAARVSYFLNLQGPCLSIDTACSASLVAIANACDTLTSGVTDLALAGGVYVMTGPEMHIKTSQAGMLSPEGRCFTFDQRADGFVPGEGVGVVLLKRLADAERDRDVIHAVIQGWGVNQDGKTNGITAPNPESQTRLEQAVYDKYQIDPANIQLVEAHGTGTKLGDPIEVEGLKNAFKKYTRNKEYCALGSVKSNIGHSLAAAGVAGVIKLILALKNKQLPPTINFERLNEHIELKDSPFFVNSGLREWKTDHAQGRQAATSSFGFSGTNAHMVIGEYLPPAEVKRTVSVVMQDGNVIIPLSARTSERLQEKARDLLTFVRKEALTVDLHEIAYTLQVGREAMEERVGVLASSVDELATKLEAYLDGQTKIEDLYQGQVKRRRDSMSILGQDDDVTEAIVDKWIAGRKLSRVLELWVNGLDLDWTKLYGQERPQRIAMPTYPFAKERYWIDAAPRYASVERAAPAVLHPLLHSNTSDLNGQRYSTTLTGDELFVTDHRVRMSEGSVQKVLPGVAYLEMARAAIQQASPAQPESSIVELYDTVWLQPVVVTEPRHVSIAIFATDTDRLGYEISSVAAGQEVLHCQGEAAFSRRPAPDRLELEQLGARMGRGRLDAADLYARFATMGLHYGPAHQGITHIDVGDQELLAQLRLPAAAEPGRDRYVLHPSLMDSALQASIGLIVDLEHPPADPPVPFVLESLRIVSACTSEMVAWVRTSPGSGREDSTVKVDLDLCDQNGNVCVEVRGFASRALHGTVPEEVTRIASNPLFDEAFYQDLIAAVVSHDVSADEAVALG